MQKLFNQTNKFKLLHLAAINGSYRCFKKLYRLLSKDELAILNDQEHILLSAIKGGEKTIIAILLKSGIDAKPGLDQEGNSAAYLTVKYGFNLNLKLLEEHGANFNVYNEQGFTTYHLAILKDDKKTLKELIQLVNQENWPNDLYSFAILKKSDKCRKLLKEKNYKCEDFNLKFNAEEIYELFFHDDAIQGKELINRFNIQKLPFLLNIAIADGKIKLVELLLARGADFNFKIKGYDAYAFAIKTEQIEVIKLFNKLGINDKLNNKLYYVNLTDNDYIKAAITGDYQRIDNTAKKLLQYLEKGNFAAIKKILA